MTTDPRIAVARDLTAIVELSERLEDQAINDANDHLMPGGLAMVALGPVASARTYDDALDDAEQEAIAWAYVNGVDPSKVMPETYEDDHEPPLQTLLFWSDDLRRTHGQEFEPTPHRPRPTTATEANIIRHHLDWLWSNEPHFEDFADDIEAARARLEALLSEGLRARRGVPCLSVECEGGVLAQPVADRREHRYCEGHAGVCTVPHERCPHDRGGLRDEWVCGTCDRRYGIEDYRRAVAQSAFLNAEWLPLEDAIARTGAKRGSIQGWATRGHVRRRTDVDTGRTTYNVEDIQARNTRGVDVAS